MHLTGNGICIEFLIELSGGYMYANKADRELYFMRGSRNKVGGVRSDLV